MKSDAYIYFSDVGYANNELLRFIAKLLRKSPHPASIP
jgi:hypothetical protein